MPQIHREQFGVFHVTTNTRNRIPWLTMNRVPEILVDNLVMTRNVYGAQLYAFCILPDHMHIIVSPGERGISAFMHSFKKNSARDITTHWGSSDFRIAAAEIMDNRTPSIPTNRSGGSKTAVIPCPLKWQKGYHDERIRDSRQRSEVLGYVQGNGMKHGLVSEILDWPWTSLHFPSVLDPMDIW